MAAGAKVDEEMGACAMVAEVRGAWERAAVAKAAKAKVEAEGG